MSKYILAYCLLFSFVAFNQVTNSGNTNAPQVNEVEQDTVQQRNSYKSMELQDVRMESKQKKSKAKVEKVSIPSVEKAVQKSYAPSTNKYTQRSRSDSDEEQLNQVVNYYQTSSPNSFEYHYYTYIAKNYDINYIDHLEKAAQLKPNNVDVLVQYVAYYELLDNKLEQKKNLVELYNKGRISHEIIPYANDLLNSVLPNGILLTHGIDDFYAVLYAQQVLQKRLDVQVLSTELFQSEFYLKKIKDKGFFIPNRKVIDVAFVKAFCEANKNAKIQLSMTFPAPYLSELINELSILGLTFVYNDKDNNLVELNRNYYEVELKKDKINSYSDDKMKALSSNYLPHLLGMKAYYEAKKDVQKVAEVDKLIQQISIQSNKKMKSSYK